MKVKYEALDGKTFDTEKDCYEYERSLHNISDLVPELAMKCKYAPLRIHLDRYVHLNGYMVDEKDCRYENFIIKDKDDLRSIMNALRNLGYAYLADSMNDLKSPVDLPEVLVLVSSRHDNNTYKYIKFSFMNKDFQDVENYRMYVDAAIKEKLGNDYYEYYPDADDGIDD